LFTGRAEFQLTLRIEGVDTSGDFQRAGRRVGESRILRSASHHIIRAPLDFYGKKEEGRKAETAF
jgi:hypothetical protein